MSSIDDILFEPISLPLSWREKCREVVTYIEQNAAQLKPMRLRFPVDRIRPPGSLLLERLMELYWLSGQREFPYVIVGSSVTESHMLMFDGTITFNRYEDGGCPLLGSCTVKRSIRDLNLVPNTYSRHFVFASLQEALHYVGSLS